MVEAKTNLLYNLKKEKKEEEEEEQKKKKWSR